MLILEKIAVFAHLCFVLGIVNAEVKTVLEKNLDFPDKQLYFVEEHLSNNYRQLEGLPYAVCKTGRVGIDDFSYTSMQNQTRCTIYVIQSDTLPEKSCNITLQANTTIFETIGDYKRVVQLGSDKVMIMWYVKKYLHHNPVRVYERLKFSIVDLTTCESTDIRRVSHRYRFSGLEETIHYFSVLPYGDSFDLIMEKGIPYWTKFSLYLNGSHTWHNWNITDNYYVSTSLEFVSVAPDSRSKGYIRFDKECDYDDEGPIFSNYKKILLIKTDDSQKLLINGTNQTSGTATSNFHQTVSIAFVSNETVSVWRFDQEGNLKLNASLDFNYTTVKLQIHNLADGGFLLLTVEIVDTTKHYHVTKFDANGKRIGLLEVPGPKYRCESRNDADYDERVALQENKAEAGSEGYCVSFVCYPLQYLINDYPDNEARLNLLLNCFTDKDFSV